MEAAAENDMRGYRPASSQPHGHQIAGPVRSGKWKSLAMYLPVLHGMTSGKWPGCSTAKGGWKGAHSGPHRDSVRRVCPQRCGIRRLRRRRIYQRPSPSRHIRHSARRNHGGHNDGTPTPFECVGMPQGALGSFAFTPAGSSGPASKTDGDLFRSNRMDWERRDAITWVFMECPLNMHGCGETRCLRSPSSPRRVRWPCPAGMNRLQSSINGELR